MLDIRRPGRLWWILVPVVIVTACAGQQQGDAPPATPSGLTASAGDAQVQLDWNANAEPDLVGYNVFRGTGGGDPDQVASVPAGTETFTDTGLANGLTYTYALDAEDAAGHRSARSAEVSATPAEQVDADPPAVSAVDPEDGAVDVAVNDSISVTFSEPMDRATAEAAFATDPGVACTFSWSALSTSLTCRPGSDLAPSTAYAVSVAATAQDDAGNAMAAAFASSFTTGTQELEACLFDDPASTYGNCTFGD